MNRLWVRLGFLFIFVVAGVITMTLVLVFLVGSPLASADAQIASCRIDEVCATGRGDNDPAAITPPPSVKLALQFLLGVLTIGLLGVVVGAFSSKRLTIPLSELANAANAVGKGDFSHRIVERGSKELIEVARAFNQMASDLHLADQVRSNLMADVSHELRTPLTVLEGSLRAAIDNVVLLDEEELANIYGQTHHLSRLVNDLQELSRAEANTIILKFEPLSLHSLLQETAHLFSPLAEEQSITLVADLHTVQTISADSVRLRQVLHNLISNALHHTPAAGTIIIRLRQQERAAIIAIQDSGNGIAPEHLPHIFDRFYRVDRSRSRVTGGSGLGLAIVRAYVVLHGGSISVHSEVGIGTTFEIHLPLD